MKLRTDPEALRPVHAAATASDEATVIEVDRAGNATVHPDPAHGTKEAPPRQDETR